MTLSSQVSVIIVNYNAGTLLIACIRAIMTQAHRIIVVDNASTDESISNLKQAFPEQNHLTIIQLTENKGFAVGCNIGLAVADTPFVLFLNPDCLLGQSAINRLVQVITTDPRAGMVGGRLINPDGSEQGGSRRAVPTPWRALVRATGLYRFARFFPKLFFDFHLHHQPLPEHPIEVEAISGALMLVRQQAIRHVGPWDEQYFLHCEDLDWCMRFQQKNWKILFIPDLEALHYQGTCSRSRPITVEWHKHKGMQRFYRKFFSKHYPFFLTWLMSVGIWLRFTAILIYYGVIRLHQSFRFLFSQRRE